jgi:DNA modification methylase
MVEITKIESDHIYGGDCNDLLDLMEEDSVDFILSDPPYGIDFMGSLKFQDKAVVPARTFKKIYRVLKKGQFLLMMCFPRGDVLELLLRNLREAGFITGYPLIFWAFAQGMKKSQNISRKADKRAGVRNVIGINPNARPNSEPFNEIFTVTGNCWQYLTAPVTEIAKKMYGAFTGFQPKPVCEVLVCARKPTGRVHRSDLFEKLGWQYYRTHWHEFTRPKKEMVKRYEAFEKRYNVTLNQGDEIWVEKALDPNLEDRVVHITRPVEKLDSMELNELVELTKQFDILLVNEITRDEILSKLREVYFEQEILSTTPYKDSDITSDLSWSLLVEMGCTWMDDGRIPTGDNIGDRSKQGQSPHPGDWDNEEYQNFEWSPDERGRVMPQLLISDNVLDYGEHGHPAGKKRKKMVTSDYDASSYKAQETRQMNRFGDSGGFSRFFSLDRWWDANIGFPEYIMRRVEELPEGISTTFPFLIVKKPSVKEKDAGCESLEKEVVNTLSGNTRPSRQDEVDAGIGHRSVRRNTHPTVKPIKLMNILIKVFTREGHVVLDPYVGSGATTIAAEISGRRFIGMEIKPKWKEIADLRQAYHSEIYEKTRKIEEEEKKFKKVRGILE